VGIQLGAGRALFWHTLRLYKNVIGKLGGKRSLRENINWFKL
jgi:hypothetical protein